MYVECEPATDRGIFFELFCFQLINDRQGNTKATMATTVIGSTNPLSNNAIEQLAMLPCKMLSSSIGACCQVRLIVVSMKGAVHFSRMSNTFFHLAHVTKNTTQKVNAVTWYLGIFSKIQNEKT